MLNIKVKFDDKKLLNMIKHPKAELKVGFWGDMYEGNDKPFYANVAKPNSITLKHPYGQPRRYGVRKPISVAEVATFNEFGGGHTPPRPFMRDTVRKNWRKWRTFIQDRLPINLDWRKMFIELGDIVKDDIRNEIITYNYPPNAPSTIKMKGFNDPLVDSGQMAESVRMEVK